MGRGDAVRRGVAGEDAAGEETGDAMGAADVAAGVVAGAGVGAGVGADVGADVGAGVGAGEETDVIAGEAGEAPGGFATAGALVCVSGSIKIIIVRSPSVK
jgi:hypothetical protein